MHKPVIRSTLSLKFLLSRMAAYRGNLRKPTVIFPLMVVNLVRFACEDDQLCDQDPRLSNLLQAQLS